MGMFDHSSYTSTAMCARMPVCECKSENVYDAFLLSLPSPLNSCPTMRALAPPRTFGIDVVATIRGHDVRHLPVRATRTPLARTIVHISVTLTHDRSPGERIMRAGTMSSTCTTPMINHASPEAGIVTYLLEQKFTNTFSLPSA